MTDSGFAALLVTVAVVLRFAWRELRERTIRQRSLWVRPTVLALLTLLLAASSAHHNRAGDLLLLVTLLASGAIGVVVGRLIVRNTSFRRAARPNAVRIKGNRVTIAIWVGALALRAVAHQLVPHDDRTQQSLNAGLIAMTTVAFTVIALACYEAMRSMSSPSESIPARATVQ